MDRKQLKAARRDDVSGAGPTLEERPPARFPGMAGAFAFFGEVLATGLLILAAGILVVTLPAALAAGIRHLRRYLAAEGSPVRLFWSDLKAAIVGGLLVGFAVVVLSLVLALDIVLANSGALPGGPVIGAVGWAGLVATATALLFAAAAWTPEHGWRGAVRSIPSAATADAIGTLYLAAAAFFVGLSAWMLPPLVIPALGCAALAVIAIPARRRRTS
ncbi:hypothetical protein ACH3VR_16550 [Microbacterium sp. B2969]|uniref:DUF624 domain-containing protein n=1 Tax=Microbacterium alkaliflavum TaxID=3248839 RepID=A0ABW7QCN6_9MICO